MSLHKGQLVRAATNIGGFNRERVPAGTPGEVVASGGVLQRARVCFDLPGNLSHDRREVLVEVEPREVELRRR